MKKSITLLLLFLCVKLSAQCFQKIKAGREHVLAIKSDGTLWVWGRNSYGRLGIGNTTNQALPVQVGIDTDWQEVSGGAEFSVAIKTNGTLWTWGNNDAGQLGDGTLNGRMTPMQVGTATDWSKIAAGYNHCLAIKSDGSLWGWGKNLDGQVGDGTATDRLSPVRIGSATNWVKIAAGGSHSLGVTSANAAYSWGVNSFYQLGNSAVQTTHFYSPTAVSATADWQDVATSSGASYSLALSTANVARSWGKASAGQCAYGFTAASRTSPGPINSTGTFTKISAGDRHSMFLSSDGTLWTSGSNLYGEIGDGTNTNQSSPVQVGTANDWVAITAGGDFSMALKSDGSLYTWGINGYGQLGNGLMNAGLTLPNKVTCGTASVTACGNYTWPATGLTYNTSGTYTDATTNTTLVLTINQDTTTSLTQSACDSYTWAANGVTYTSSGIYTNVTTNASGCSNTATLNLTVNNSTTSDVTETACDSYTWPANGVTYTTSGTYTRSSTNAAGCAHTATLHLIINNSTTSAFTQTACDSYTWAANGVTYTSSGIYTNVTTNASGCSNTATLNLTVNNSTASDVTETACDSYTWPASGVTYTASGTYTNVSTNAAGCTHTATLHLTINNSTTSAFTQTACDSYTWAANGVTYTSSGIYTNVTTNASGCSNTATLNLTVNNSTTSDVTATACDSYTWPANGVTYTASGTYTNVSTNASGCTHTATLNLTVNNSTVSSVTVASCDSYTWAANGLTYTNSGTYTNSTTNASGCSHTDTLNLTINNSTAATLNETACDTYTWAANGATFTSSGTYINTTTNAAGCTHTATLNLTINHSSSSNLVETACDIYTWAANGLLYTSSGTYTHVTTNAAGCTDTATLNLTINQAEMPAGESTQNIIGNVANDATISDIVVSPSTVVWYASEADALSGTAPLDAATVLTNGATYYAVNTSAEGCSSAPFAVMVTVALATNTFDAAQFAFYPNPTSNVIHIQYKAMISGVTLFNVLGQEVLKQAPRANEFTIDLSGLPSGAYFAKLTALGQLKIVKIIKE